MIRIKQKIDKAEINNYPTVTFSGRIIVIQTEAEAEKAVSYLLAQRMVGIDTETKPAFKKGVVHKVALMQVSTPDTCFLFRLNMTGLCPAIIRLIESKEVMKIGLSLKDDLHNLRMMGDFKEQRFVELQSLAAETGIKEMSLQKIYAILFNEKISKRQRLTNWEADVLNDGQKMYAAIDAWVCLRIYDRLCELKSTGNYELEPLPEPVLIP